MGLEVVAVKLTGTYPCGTANGAPPTIRRGWGGSSACKCDPKKQFLNCEGVPPPPAEWNDPFGDETMRKGQHTTRHTDTNEVWELAMQYSFGKHNLVVDPRKQNGAVDWSPGHIPDINALNKGPGGFHIVADTKVANFLASTYEGDVGTLAAIVERAASIPFAASGEYYQSLVHGRDKIENPPGTTQRLNRRNFTGTKVAKRGDYGPAKLLGHHAVMHLQEVSGALHPESHGFLRSLAELHDKSTTSSRTTSLASPGRCPTSRHTSCSASPARSTWPPPTRSATRSPPVSACPVLCPRAACGTGPCYALGSKPGAPPFCLRSRWT